MELLERAQRGPITEVHAADHSRYGCTAEQGKAIAEDFARRYQGWSRTWLLPLLYDLVPELRGLDKVADVLEAAGRKGASK